LLEKGIETVSTSANLLDVALQERQRHGHIKLKRLSEANKKVIKEVAARSKEYGVWIPGVERPSGAISDYITIYFPVNEATTVLELEQKSIRIANELR